jgi:hypothetical protein
MNDPQDAPPSVTAVIIPRTSNSCLTCGDTGQITVPDPRDSAWHPRRPIIHRCDCTDKDTQ